MSELKPFLIRITCQAETEVAVYAEDEDKALELINEYKYQIAQEQFDLDCFEEEVSEVPDEEVECTTFLIDEQGNVDQSLLQD